MWEGLYNLNFNRMEFQTVRSTPGSDIGSELVEHAKQQMGGTYLWTLERNERAIAFYKRHGFELTGERMEEPGTEEYLVRMALQ